MPITRQITVDELNDYAAFARRTVATDEIKEQVDNGARLELIESAFSDAGDDYTEVRLDGRVLIRVNGY
jgi:hypothetical protein